MISKIYPRDQIKQYLFIDVIALVFLLYMVLTAPSALGLWAKLGLLTAYLIAFYVALWRRDFYLLVAVLAGVATLTLLGVHLSASMLVFGFVFADLLGRARSKWHIAIGIAAIGLMTFIVSRLESDDPFVQGITFLPVMIVQMILPVVIHIIERTKSLQGKLDAANQQLEHYIQQEERQRIARDLHDTLGQTLAMIKLKSELAARWIDRDSSKAKAELMDILTSSRTALKQVRELVSDMKFISLTQEIERSRELLRTAGIQLEAAGNSTLPLLSSVEETMLALCVREATTNIIKHSQAKHCFIRIDTAGDHIHVTIADDGVGLGGRNSGNGISSMMERMKSLQGSLTVDDAEGGGTVVSLLLPFRQQEKEDKPS
ncbi:sensor histidine kinase [Paenibacillus cisolokensis]|uniref:sensor histidine kinase n=1 Tax=Paenibacillus cisolokensis TaxID=1658519 RepID=UPI003D2835D7